MATKLSFFKKIRITRNLNKLLNVSSKDLSESELLFLNNNELVNKDNVQKVIELYRNIGEKNTLIALQNNFMNLGTKEIMDRIIQDFPEKFEIVNNQYFSINFPSLNFRNNIFIEKYRQRQLITLGEYNKNKTDTSDQLPTYFFSPVTQEYLKISKSNENINFYLRSLTELENNNTISIENYISLLKLGMNLQYLDIKITENNNPINENFIKESIAVVDFLMTNKLWETYRFFINLNNNPFEELLNYIKSDKNNTNAKFIYNFIQEQCNLYTDYDLLMKVDGKYVLKNNSELLTDEDIYEIIDKSTLEYFNVSPEKLKLLANHFNLKTGIAGAFYKYYNFSETAFYSDLDNNFDLISLINSEPMDFEKIYNFCSLIGEGNTELAENYINNIRNLYPDELHTGYETVKPITLDEFKAYYKQTFLAWDLDEFYYDFNFPIKISLKNKEQIFYGLEKVKELYVKILELLKSKNIEDIDERKLKSSFASVLISFDYFGINNNLTNNDNEIINWFNNNINSSDDLPLFYTCFDNITYKHNSTFTKELLENYKKINILEIRTKHFNYIKANIGTLNRLLKQINIFGFEDLLYRYYLKYNDCSFSVLPVEDILIKNMVSQEMLNKLQEAFLTAMQQKTASLPYFSFENKDYNFDMYKTWDHNLLTVDVENRYQDIGFDNLCDAISNGKRIIEITNKHNSQKIYAILTRTKENNLNIEIKPTGQLNEIDIQDIIANLENNLDQKDGLNKIFINNKLIKTYNSNIQENIEYFDTPIYINRQKDRTLYDKNHIKINNIFNQAFSKQGVGNFMCESEEYLVGRDWVLQFSSTNTSISLDVVGRYNEQQTNKIGSEEMKQAILNVGKKYDKVACSAHATSYYMLAKWASEGKIFITEDIQREIDREGSLQAFSNPTGVYYSSDRGVSPDFYKNVITKSRYINTGMIQDVVFKVVDQNNLTYEEQAKLEEQKAIYRAAVAYLDQRWEEEKNRSSVR